MLNSHCLSAAAALIHLNIILHKVVCLQTSGKQSISGTRVPAADALGWRLRPSAKADKQDIYRDNQAPTNLPKFVEESVESI